MTAVALRKEHLMSKELERDEAGRIILQKVRYSGVRKIIGSNMRQSMDNSPQATITTQADMTAVETVKRRFGEQGIHVTFTDILLKLIGQALIECPAVNAALLEGKQIVQYGSANIGVAVGTDHGLYVPVIRDVQDKSIPAISAELKDCVKNIREGNILPEYFSGGTFSVSNLGMFGIDVMTPITNAPEAAILCLGAVRKQYVIVEDQPVIRPMIWLSLTLDHAVMDGMDGAKFLQTVKRMIEEPWDITKKK